MPYPRSAKNALKPRVTAVRRSTVKQIPQAEAKDKVLTQLAQGAKVDTAMANVGRTWNTYRDWYKNDESFRDAVKAIRSTRADAAVIGRPSVPDFDVFCREYLNEPLFPHQVNMWDAIEGRRPRYLDPAMTWEPGDPGRIIINIPPNHAKTTSITMNYVVWRIHKNPSISIAIISKSQNFAKKILNGIKTRLTDSSYRKMHLAFAPDGGWRSPDESWTATMIYVQGKYQGETEKEPTVEAVGLGGQIYGGRFHLIILDDVIDSTNAHQWEPQVDWAMTMLDSRLPPDGGKLVVVGTRLAATDLNSELRARTNEDEEQFFSYFSQPAVLEYASDRTDWRTLWPWQLSYGEDDPMAELRCIGCYRPAVDSDGNACCDRMDIAWLKPRWNGERLAKKRFPLGERKWSLVWQQQQIPDDATFNSKTVQTSINHQRQPGVMRRGAMGHRPDAMDGLYVVLGLDPATVGFTAAIVAGLDRFTGKRWILDGFNVQGMSPSSMRSEVLRLVDTYRVNEAVIERNAFQKFLTDDPALKSGLQSRGCKLTAHYTTADKRDDDFGVMSLAPLFESTGRPPRNQGGGSWSRVSEGDLIELPDDRQSGWCSTLISQLISWEPQGMSQRTRTDLVMALWFCDIAFKRVLGRNKKHTTHLDNPWAAKGRIKTRDTVNIADLIRAKVEEQEVIG